MEALWSSQTHPMQMVMHDGPWVSACMSHAHGLWVCVHGSSGPMCIPTWSMHMTCMYVMEHPNILLWDQICCCEVLWTSHACILEPNMQDWMRTCEAKYPAVKVKYAAVRSSGPLKHAYWTSLAVHLAVGHGKCMHMVHTHVCMTRGHVYTWVDHG